MKRVSLLVVLFAVTCVFANEIDESGSYEVYDTSEDTVNFENSSEDYETCIAEGACVPIDMPGSTESPYLADESLGQDSRYEHHVPGSQYEHHVPDSHYTKMCHKLGQQFHGMEALHPELKNLKMKLLQMLDASGSGFKLHCNEGESIITKLLDTVIFLAEKLKADFSRDPIVVSTSIPSEEIIAEEHDIPVQVGSVRGIPGKHYPNYSEVPLTSFSCSDRYIPGFYADLETGCQVFHVCYEHRRESFLCPVGTIFNQPILACDYWYSSNCSQAPLYYDVNTKEAEYAETSKEVSNIGNLITNIIEGDKLKDTTSEMEIPEGDLDDLLKFLPIKAKIVEFEQPKIIKSKPVMVLPEPVELEQPKIIESKPVMVLPEPVEFEQPEIIKSKPVVVFPKPVAFLKPKPLPLVKPKLAVKAAMKFPIVKAAIKIPLAKAKFAAVPVVKAKLVSAAVPVVKAKLAVPIIKSKFVALPLMKTKYAAAAKYPVFKAKFAAPVVKAKVVSAAVPVIKAKLAVPVIKSKFVALPLMKTKYAAAAKYPVFKAKFAAPVVKAKVVSAAVPVFKAKVAAPVIKSKLVAVPLMKAKYAAAAKYPVFKAKTTAKVIPFVKLTAKKSKVIAGVPFMKAKFAKSAMISPMTKKVLALGYMKLLKAKKLALMG